MTFTERELALIMVALDSTSSSIREASAGCHRMRTALIEAADMNTLWNRVHQERLYLLREGKEKRS
jgi:hypothetical protein